MGNIIELLNKYHLQWLRDESLEIPHIVYEQKTSDGNNIISYNFVVQYSELLEKKLFDKDHLEESFYAFEKKYFSKYFFREDTDLKWNYYLIIIVREEESMDPEICQLEQDDKFLRKLIMTSDEFEIYLDHGKGIEDSSKQNINGIDTYAEWQRELSSVGLEGILSFPYASSKVKEYLEKGTPIRQQGRPIENWEINDKANLKYSIQRIDSLFIEDFRTHCLLSGLEIPLSKVNLISGNNGAGKSSICSAIEYALTGEIADTGTETGTAAVTIINKDNKTEQLKSTIKDKKSLDKLWYGTTTRARNSSLNRNFRTFNYLGLEAAGKYMQELEIDDLVKNILFGTEVTEAELKMERYGKEFAEQKKEREKQRIILNDEISQEINIIQNTAEVKRISPEDLQHYFQELGYKGGLSQDTLNMDEGFLKKIRGIIIQNAKHVELLSDKCDINETGAIIKEKEKSLNEKRDYNNALIERRALITREMGVCQEQRKNNIDLIDSFYDRMKNLQDLLYRGEEVQDIFFGKQDFLNCRNEYERKCAQKKELISWIEHNQIYMDAEGNDTELETAIQNKESVIYELKREIENISLLIEQQKAHGKNLNILILEVSGLIERISESNEHIKSCPLCGTGFSTEQKLIEAINRQKTFAEMNQTIEKTILTQKLDKEKQLHEEKNVLKRLRDRKEHIIQKRMAIVKLKTIMPVDESKNGDEIKTEIQTALVELQEWLENHVILYKYAQRVLADKEFLVYSEEEEWISYLRKLLLHLNEDITTTQQSIKEQDEWEQELKKKNLELTQEIDMYSEEEWKEYQLKKRGWEELNLIWEIDEDVPILEWIKKYDTFVQMIDYAQEMYEKQESIQIRKERIQSLQREKEKLEKEYERCKAACAVIDRQRHLKDVMEDFLTDNAKQIELFFKLLHRPKEFGTLKIENGNIGIIRKSSGQPVESKQMSTGQRMALAFSVMITLHLKAVNAPNFLMLDEPVANLDDMHVLNLIDLLREMAISGTQIIITTANGQISKFLRRKFSFLEEEFSHFELVRKGSEQTQIDVVHYSYTKKAEAGRRRLEKGNSSTV